MSNVSLLQQLCELGMGARGFEFISDNAEHTAPADMVFTALAVVEDAVFTKLVAAAGAEVTGNSMLNETLPAGDIIYGRFTSVQLASGKIRAYKGVYE
jgi:hypothetical protein